jgi:hypothetical protein
MMHLSVRTWTCSTMSLMFEDDVGDVFGDTGDRVELVEASSKRRP